MGIVLLILFDDFTIANDKIKTFQTKGYRLSTFDSTAKPHSQIIVMYTFKICSEYQ